MGRAIWRLDYAWDDIHFNPLDAPDGVPKGRIRGPHYHAWEDNRHLVTRNVLPRNLSNARLLSRRIRRFEQAFRWFCGQTNIKLAPGDVPELPKPVTLL